MKLTAKIKSAADSGIELRVPELPGLEAHARNVAEIPDAVKDAAARLTGRPKDDFDVEVRY